ncbi:MAG: Lrp/AsnC family transcriptional regulator [Gammaproteobacteria bacterium]|nr:Lrp/AsnC family transcriptional regulator [Gammaproteobacteria bacterium]MYF37246.1 Lrp/AsnC family transcriptional regulator [Gammaproteobacteria bacterium]
MTQLDRLDISILRYLQENSSISIQDLGAKVGLSATPCWRRVKRLQNEGLIRKQVALLDAKLLELDVNVFVHVKLTEHSDEVLKMFEESVANIPEVVECYSVSGDTDFLLRIVVADVATYETLLYKKLIRLREVGTLNSMFALRQVKYTTELPLAPVTAPR